MAIPGLEQAAAAISDLAKERARDRDETRRLCYMALLVPRTKRYNLAGTLVNALKHHHGLDMAVEDIEHIVVSYVEGDNDDLSWLRERIAELSGEPQNGGATANGS